MNTIRKDLLGFGAMTIAFFSMANSNAGQKIFMNAVGGDWSLPICAAPTATCPGPGSVVTVELLSGGMGGTAGGSSATGFAGPGGRGGLSGEYAKIQFKLPNALPNSESVYPFSALKGVVGPGGSGGIASNQNISGTQGAPGWTTTLQIVKNSMAWGIAVLAGGGKFLFGPNAVITGISAPPAYLGLQQFNIISQLPSVYGSNGASGATCAGGTGGAGGLLIIGAGHGGAGGHGGYHRSALPVCLSANNNFGLTNGSPGMPGAVKISW